MGTRKFRTASRDNALEAAKQLMSEREKYENWLEDLEAKKDSTPAKVFDRVRQDYLARLQTVMDQLGQHTATLQEHAETLMEKLRELEDAEAENTEAQEEAAIRKQVGEITSAEWESGSRKAQRELAKIKENQTVILADLNRIRDLLGGDDDEESPPRGKSSKDFNELEFLSSVVGPPTPSVPTPVQDKRASAPTKAPAAPRATPPAAAPRPTPSAAPAAAVKSTPAAAAPAAPPPAAPPPAQTPSAPVAATAPAPEPAPEPVEAPRTLKCQECGTMNYASEWYCERCGAEMTVV